jgi:hypothetical protein
MYRELDGPGSLSCLVSASGRKGVDCSSVGGSVQATRPTRLAPATGRRYFRDLHSTTCTECNSIWRLTGLRVVIEDKRCELQEYDFVANRWFSKDESPWPLTRARAGEWLVDWNDEDRFAAVNALTKPVDDRAPMKLVGPTT